MRGWICSSVNKTRSRSPSMDLCLQGALICIFENQILIVLLIQKADLDIRIELAETFHLPVFLGYQRLFHSGELHIEIAIGKVEVRRERFDDIPILVVL